MKREEFLGTIGRLGPAPRTIEVDLAMRGLHIGDVVHIAGKGSDFEEYVADLRIGPLHVKEAQAGTRVTLPLTHAAREGADVFVVHEVADTPDNAALARLLDLPLPQGPGAPDRRPPRRAGWPHL